MAKRYTASELNQITRDVLCGAMEHIEAIKTELRKIDLGSGLPPSPEIRDESILDPVALSRAKVLSLTLTCINDIIHPAHKLCYSFFPSNKEYFDALVRNHALAVSKKMLPPCLCETCKEIHGNKKEDSASVIGSELSGTE